MADAGQLVFDIAPPPSYAGEDYVVGPCNAQAHQLATSLAWPTPVGLILAPCGAGKTHLATLFAQRFSAVHWFAGAVPQLTHSGGAIIIDGLETWVGAQRSEQDEDALFHTLEVARANAWVVLVTCQGAPETLGIRRPDTVSRLRAGERASVEAPDDALFTAIAIKLFTDRHLMVDPSIAEYLLQRMERSYANLAKLVRVIDERSLAAGRRITKSLARDVLDAYELSQN
ncbi:MAG: hypothetical protein AB8B88_09210 [Devosiaceae bacterium]